MGAGNARKVGDRHAKASRREYVRERQHFRARRYRLRHPIDDDRRVVLPGDDLHDVEDDAARPDEEIPAVAAPWVLLVGRQNTIAWDEVEAKRDATHAVRRTRRKNHFVCGTANQVSGLLANDVELLLEITVAVHDRIAFEELPGIDRLLHDGSRRGAEGASLQVDEAIVEHEIARAREAAIPRWFRTARGDPEPRGNETNDRGKSDRREKVASRPSKSLQRSLH